jgi:6,7-dimethyl-8-ribityllumazine synthase
MTMSQPTTAVVVAAEFNKPLIDAMIEHATDELSKHSVQIAHTVRVPGCYEVPLVADAALSMANVSLVIVLGYIERGETQHGEVMGHVTHQALVSLELQYKKPIGIGIIGPGATPEQAEARKEGYARAAARAAVASVAALHNLRRS